VGGSIVARGRALLGSTELAHTGSRMAELRLTRPAALQLRVLPQLVEAAAQN